MNSVSHKTLGLGLTLSLLGSLTSTDVRAFQVDHHVMYLLAGVSPSSSADLTRRNLTFVSLTLTDAQRAFLAANPTNNLMVWQNYATAPGRPPSKIFYVHPRASRNSVTEWNTIVGGDARPQPGQHFTIESHFSYDRDSAYGQTSCVGLAFRDNESVSTLTVLPDTLCFSTPPANVSCEVDIPATLDMGHLTTGQHRTITSSISIRCSGVGTTPLTIGPGTMTNDKSNLAVSIGDADTCSNLNDLKRITVSGGATYGLCLEVSGLLLHPRGQTSSRRAAQVNYQ